jgi:hypothetical protein
MNSLDMLVKQTRQKRLTRFLKAKPQNTSLKSRRSLNQFRCRLFLMDLPVRRHLSPRLINIFVLSRKSPSIDALIRLNDFTKKPIGKLNCRLGSKLRPIE